MVEKTKNWSKHWKSSKDPRKQRKYRENAPKHVKDKLIKIRLHSEITEEINTRTMPVRRGDKVKVMTGDYKGREGIVDTVDRENTKIYVNEITRERVDGTQKMVPFPPSNLQIEALNIEDLQRIDKYEDVDVEKIEVDEEELEQLEEQDEESEMMQQMQGGESGAHEEDEEDDSSEETETEETEETQETEEAKETENKEEEQKPSEEKENEEGDK